MESITNIRVNMQKPSAAPIVYAKQGDKYTRKIKATLYDGDTPWVPPNNVYCLVRCAKPDRTSVVYDKLENNTAAVITTNGSPVVTICLRQQVTTAEGDVRLEVNFYAKNGTVVTEQLTTFSVIVRVEKSAVDNVVLTSTSEFDLLTDKINQVLEAEQALAGIEVNAIQNYTSTSPSVNVTRSQSDNHYIFNFGLPKGDIGNPASITSRAVTYYQTATFVNSPASGISSNSWQSTMPEPIAQQYMYTRVADTYNDGTTKYSYSVSRNGKNGTGSVDSVNNKDGDVQLTAADVGAVTPTEMNTAISSVFSNFLKIKEVSNSVSQASSQATNNVINLNIDFYLDSGYTFGGVLSHAISGTVASYAYVGHEVSGTKHTLKFQGSFSNNVMPMPFSTYGATITAWILEIKDTSGS